ncbi:MAG: fasciclin domain-containing protein, partial [Gemmatimonadales bacterium]
MFNLKAPRKLLTLSAVGLALTAAACSDDIGTPAIDDSILGIADSSGQFSTLVTAVEAAGLSNTLRDGGPFTVFAPTDAAFNKLPAGTLDALLADTDALQEVLLYHVVSGEFAAADIQSRSSIETVQGQPIVITEGSVVLNGVTVSDADIRADNGIIHVIDDVLLPPSLDIVETATSNDDFSTLAAAVSAAGLIDALQMDGPYTVFAPTDAAFDKLPAGTLDALLADPAALAEVLTYHVVPGRVYARDLDGVVSTETLSGFPVLFDLSAGAKINSSNIVATDLLTTNGVIHVIDEVLLPPSGDIVETAVAAGFSTLATAVTEAGLVEALQGEGPFSVFAPTDEAFAALPEGVLAGLLADTEALTSVLLYHVVPGQIFSGNLTDGATAQTLQGQSVTVDLSSGVDIDDASVTAADIIATNGVIHVIDEVLLLDIVQTVLSNDDFSTLATAVSAAGLVDALRGDGPFTVFAPTNAAFDALPAGTLNALLADTDALTEVLTYHVLDGAVYAGDLPGVVSAQTLAGYPVLFDLSSGAQINESNIVVTDIPVRNGVIHVIDAVLLPPEGDIVETAVAAGFSTLAAALEAAELVSALQADGPFTVFAPTNDAFANLPAGTLESLLLPENQTQLQSILLYHVVSGQVFSGNLTDGGTAETLQGQSV